LGVLLYELGNYAEALDLFSRSLELYGPYDTVVYNMRMCYQALKQIESAFETFNEVPALDQDF
jgi:tetratricopeptide (TPR) repeat protein